MTTIPKTFMCECEECLALRAAEDDPVLRRDRRRLRARRSTYEIDHLGIGSGSQWGEFAVYCDGEHVASFAIAESMLRPGSRPAGLPVCADELVRLARQALSGWTGREVCPSRGYLQLDQPPAGGRSGPGGAAGPLGALAHRRQAIPAARIGK